MNRREFVRGSLVSGVSGVIGEDLFECCSTLDAEVSRGLAQSPNAVAQHAVYARLLDPRENPDYSRKHVRPPSWDTFNKHTHFTALRHLPIENGKLIDYGATIDKYTETYELGEVLWLFNDVLFTRNIEDLANEIERRKLFLFDIWGYVPGSGPGGMWQQFEVPQGVFELLESKLGDRWLGMDNGEQDGRYIGKYAPELYPASSSRFEQYLNFQRHFERLTSDLGNKMATLVALNFGHYFLKEGVYTLIGAETGQGLPNAQVFYAFIRGAGKQYGVLWFGNASVYNRWGQKSYSVISRTSGPTKGTSLSLLKRLMYSQILYNSVIVGFEKSLLGCADATAPADHCSEDTLSPIGKIQQAARKWIREVGQPGPQIVPIALMIDCFAGWTVPRHLYSSNTYRVWGNLPYDPGDYLTDSVIDMIYPGYQDSSYFHDEAGFLSPAPYGDASDCILSDAPAWLLAQYSLLVVAGGLQCGAELREKFEDYMRQGGHLVITAGNLSRFPNGLAGIQTQGELRHVSRSEKVQIGSTQVEEANSFDLHRLLVPPTAHVLAQVAGAPAAVELPFGAGRITVFACPFGIYSSGNGAPAQFAGEIRSEVDRPLSKPYPMLKHVQYLLDKAFRGQMLFEAGDGLSMITCRKGPGEYTLGVSNNTWQQRPLKIISHCGRIDSIQELNLDQSEKGAIGYLPENLRVDVGESKEGRIAGGDIRVFRVSVSERNVRELPHVPPLRRPRGRAITIGRALSIKEEILARPSFFEHYDSIVIDWRYLQERERYQLDRESKWLRLQGVKVFVDLTSGINLYPDLRLIDNIHQDYVTSIATIDDVLTKMEVFPSRDLILSLHRYPENNFTVEQVWQSFEDTFRSLCMRAEQQGVTLHLRLRSKTPPMTLETAVKFVERVNAHNLRLAPPTAFLLTSDRHTEEMASLLKDRVGLWLLNAPQEDVTGFVWNENAPINGYPDTERLARILAISPESPKIFDVSYKSRDEEYLDAKFLQTILS